jgi:hypothetical protein
MPYLDHGELPELAGPYEFLDATPNQPVTIRVIRFAQGKALIQPRTGQPAKWIPVLRVWVPDGDKLTLPPYWDITAKHLQAAMLAWLEGPGNGTGKFLFTKTQLGPTGRHANFEAGPLA